MKFGNLFRIAARSLGKNKLRSFLTMLGIIIGVGSVIAMLAIGQGSKENIEKSISSLGTNVIMVLPNSSSQGGVRSEAGTSQKLTLEDAIAIGNQCPSVKYFSPIVRTTTQIVAGSQNWRTSVYGAYPDYFQIRNFNVSDGTYFEMSEDRAAAKVCVIGLTVVQNLFGENVDPVGSYIRINNIPFKVIGVLDRKGQNAMGQDQDDVIIAPFSTVQKRILASTFVQQILVSAVSESQITQASAEITDLMKERHRITDSQEPDFTIRTQSEIGAAAASTSAVLTGLLASIASISLLVGGIGIMNIMLVSVTERTREIGIRMAVGARGFDVLLQFLIEAILLSFIGGLLGIIVGLGASWLVSDLMGWPVSIAINSILLSFLFSTAIGIFFGWYPARKAANLNPIEALRYE
jgi:putative ABC transport system permease protein